MITLIIYFYVVLRIYKLTASIIKYNFTMSEDKTYLEIKQNI